MMQGMVTLTLLLVFVSAWFTSKKQSMITVDWRSLTSQTSLACMPSLALS